MEGLLLHLHQRAKLLTRKVQKLDLGQQASAETRCQSRHAENKGHSAGMAHLALGWEPELWALFVTLAGIPPQDVCRPIMHQDQGSLKKADRSQPIGSHSPRQPQTTQTTFLQV